MTDWPIRNATDADLPSLAELWHDGWHEAHADHVPAELTAKRTLDSFAGRLAGYGDTLRVAGPKGAPLGMCVIREDELDQLFVSPDTRGTGLAARLLADGEARLAASGVETARLLCVIQNERAAAFYRREGWVDQGIRKEAVQTETGPFAFDVLLFQKRLALE